MRRLLLASAALAFAGAASAQTLSGPPVPAGVYTTTGALKGNGSGTVSQAAASDLSNGVTGSGAVVLATAPALVTPSLGVATATSLAAGGCTIGTNGACVSGPTNLAGGTVTTSSPVVNITETLNGAGVSFTGFLANFTKTAASNGSLLMDWQVGGVSKFSVDILGDIFVVGGMYLPSGVAMQFDYTGSNNYNIQKSGTNLAFAATGGFTFSKPIQPQVTTVSGLPSCTSGLDGFRASVTDATVTTFASAVAGSGANHVPVYCDGSGTPAWKIG